MQLKGVLRNSNQCHAEGGVTKGGVSKCEQTQTNADKRKQTQRRKRKQTQANASKRGQTQTNAHTPLYCGFFSTPPFAIPNYQKGAVPVTGPSVPLTGPSVPLTGPSVNCLIVGHSPGLNCRAPRGASKIKWPDLSAPRSQR